MASQEPKTNQEIEPKVQEVQSPANSNHETQHPSETNSEFDSNSQQSQSPANSNDEIQQPSSSSMRILDINELKTLNSIERRHLTPGNAVVTTLYWWHVHAYDSFISPSTQQFRWVYWDPDKTKIVIERIRDKVSIRWTGPNDPLTGQLTMDYDHRYLVVLDPDAPKWQLLEVVDMITSQNEYDHTLTKINTEGFMPPEEATEVASQDWGVTIALWLFEDRIWTVADNTKFRYWVNGKDIMDPTGVLWHRAINPNVSGEEFKNHQ